MRTEEEVRRLLGTHLEAKIDENILKGLAEDYPGTSIDYWRGYHEGVTFGYKAVLLEEK
jgi:hypothetical protein